MIVAQRQIDSRSLHPLYPINILLYNDVHQCISNILPLPTRPAPEVQDITEIAQRRSPEFTRTIRGVHMPQGSSVTKSRPERRVLLHVHALFSGSAAADVPRDLLPQVDSHLTELLARSPPQKAPVIESLLQAVKNVERRLGLIESQARRTAARDSIPTASLEAALGKLCAGSPVQSLDQALLPDLIPFVRQRICQRSEGGDFGTAQLYEDALGQLTSACYSSLRSRDQIARLDRARRELESQVQRDLRSHNLQVEKDLARSGADGRM